MLVTLQSNEHVGHLSIYVSDKSLKPRKCRVFELEEPVELQVVHQNFM